MAHNRLRLDGLDALKAELRRMPAELASDAQRIVFETADEAAAQIIRNYPRRTGRLREGVKVTHKPSTHGATAIVRNTAPHAAIYEIGTQARHTELGANRGSMPPGNVFGPVAARERREMVNELIGLLRSAGATKVTGG